MRRKARILKTWRLLHVHILLQIPVKKSITHINLAKNPAARDSQGENQPNRGRLDDRAESFAIIQTMLLSKATSN
jgi:hypothetical protein